MQLTTVDKTAVLEAVNEALLMGNALAALGVDNEAQMYYAEADRIMGMADLVAP